MERVAEVTLRSRPFRVVMLLIIVSYSSIVRADEDAEQLLNQWLEKQAKVVTWQADFVQTRTIPALVSPLETEGTVYFQSPNLFRWEIGKPARTIALRSEEQVTIYYPQLNRAEQYSMAPETRDPWKDALAMLDAGFPKSREELESKFELEEISVADEIGQVVMVPKKRQTRKFLTRVELRFNPEKSGLTSAEFEFGDGTVLRNEFSSGRIGDRIGQELFDLPDGVDVEASK